MRIPDIVFCAEIDRKTVKRLYMKVIFALRILTKNITGKEIVLDNSTNL